MMRSDLLLEETIAIYIEEIRKTKDFLIFNNAGEETLTHLATLAGLEMDLVNLKENLPFIEIDLEKLSNAK
ncbi:hypothetical protein [Mangrovibacterium sp.]|uniref:hypothetical protein n=1 Tax=Mangrovibacterium sp. TaxID=1961364 RepID=UPI003568DAD1